jgi:hypothetical protein
MWRWPGTWISPTTTCLRGGRDAACPRAQLVVPEREAVADRMVGLLREAGVELWVNKDPEVHPEATFSSALANVFGLPDSAQPSEERTEADSSAHSQAMLHLIDAARGEDLIRMHALVDTSFSHAITGGCCRCSLQRGPPLVSCSCGSARHTGIQSYRAHVAEVASALASTHKCAPHLV